MQNKRYYTRYRVEADARIGTSSGKIYKAELVDLRAEGARLRVNEIPDLKKGEIVSTLGRQALSERLTEIALASLEESFLR